jgi:hypothetical protein
MNCNKYIFFYFFTQIFKYYDILPLPKRWVTDILEFEQNITSIKNYKKYYLLTDRVNQRIWITKKQNSNIIHTIFKEKYDIYRI